MDPSLFEGPSKITLDVTRERASAALLTRLWDPLVIAVLVVLGLFMFKDRITSFLLKAVERGNKFETDGRTVLLTGGSQGLGLSVACALASRGANVAIVARDPIKLEKAIKQIELKARKDRSQRFLQISADVTSFGENQRILRQVTMWNGGKPPDIVWACAGFSHPSLFLETDFDTHRQQMEINYWAATYLLNGTLNAWLGPMLNRFKAGKTDVVTTDGNQDDNTQDENQLDGQHNGQLDGHHSIGPITDGSDTKTTGAATDREEPRDSAVSKSTPKQNTDNAQHFIFTSSVVAYCGIAGYSPYSPPKAALRSLCDAVRQELLLYKGAAAGGWPQGYFCDGKTRTTGNHKEVVRPIKLHLVTPGNILTPGFEHENKIKHPVTKKLEETDEAQAPEQVAERAIKELEKGHYLVTTNPLGKLIKCASLNNSIRNGTGLVDTLMGLVAMIAFLFVTPDMDRIVFRWGKNNGHDRF